MPKCNACGGEYSSLELIFPPVPSQELKPTKDGEAFRHVKTGELYRIWQLCKSCMETLRAQGGGVIALPFKVKTPGGGENKRADSGKPAKRQLNINLWAGSIARTL